ncbi:MAG TPA: ATP-binding protein [Candidatus Paceibacterota bacterium]|nr:ATP-binding protein [Verrucomicrobiota bacterium]HRZ47499.1 ATP-binding protein [Candidatus Paceibacterota bacterium]
MFKPSQKHNVDQLTRLLHDDFENAAKAEQEGRYPDAAQCWLRMASNFRRLAEAETNLLESARLIHKASRCEERARAATKKPAQASKGGQMEAPAPEDAGYANMVASLIHRSEVTWEDIGGMEAAKHDLKYAMGLLLARKPESLRRLEIPTRILLYGPPGTGKTLLAAAAANTLGAVFYNVKVSDLLSKYFGESSKLISALYDHARDQADSGLAVVFIDEIESLVASRDRLESGAEKRIMSTILAEMDGLAEKKITPNIITIAATNLPWDLDLAFLSRMDLRVLVELPDAAARAAIFRLHLTDRGYALGNDLTLESLAEMTDGMVGRDIQRICKKVVMRLLASVNEDVPRKVDQGTIRDYVLDVRPVRRADFDDVIREIKESKEGAAELGMTLQRIDRYRKWHRQFGAI